MTAAEKKLKKALKQQAIESFPAKPAKKTVLAKILKRAKGAGN